VGEHRNNPFALAAQARMPAGPKLGVDLHGGFALKRNVLPYPAHRIRDGEGGRTEVHQPTTPGGQHEWVPVPDDVKVIIAGAPPAIEDLDWVVTMLGTLADTSVVAPDGRIPVGLAPLVELYRCDAREHMAKFQRGAKPAINGGG
jgi:hypothetical protein